MPSLGWWRPPAACDVGLAHTARGEDLLAAVGSLHKEMLQPRIARFISIWKGNRLDENPNPTIPARTLRFRDLSVVGILTVQSQQLLCRSM